MYATPEQVYLVALTVEDRTGKTLDREAGEQFLHQALPTPNAASLDDLTIQEWWVAEDDRRDGSDNDSAVFVHPGKKGEAAAILLALGLTESCNAPSLLSVEDALIAAQALLTYATERSGHPALPFLDVANHLEVGGLEPDAAIRAALEHPAMIRDLTCGEPGDWWMYENEAVCGTARDLGILPDDEEN